MQSALHVLSYLTFRQQPFVVHDREKTKVWRALVNLPKIRGWSQDLVLGSLIPEPVVLSIKQYYSIP